MQLREGRVFRKSPEFIFASRDFFERLLRSEVLQCNGIKQIAGTATQLRTSEDDMSRVSGVCVRLEHGTEKFFPAAFVVGML